MWERSGNGIRPFVSVESVQHGRRHAPSSIPEVVATLGLFQISKHLGATPPAPIVFVRSFIVWPSLFSARMAARSSASPASLGRRGTTRATGMPNFVTMISMPSRSTSSSSRRQFRLNAVVHRQTTFVTIVTEYGHETGASTNPHTTRHCTSVTPSSSWSSKTASTSAPMFTAARRWQTVADHAHVPASDNSTRTTRYGHASLSAG